jgi:tRNA(fMet)-specific endonuclease VapC
MQLYMMDRNTASYIIKGEPAVVREHLLEVPMTSVCLSSITQAELLRGVTNYRIEHHLSLENWTVTRDH